MYTSASLEAGITLITSVTITAALAQSQNFGKIAKQLMILTLANTKLFMMLKEDLTNRILTVSQFSALK
jgi:hypothetical protein